VLANAGSSGLPWLVIIAIIVLIMVFVGFVVYKQRKSSDDDDGGVKFADRKAFANPMYAEHGHGDEPLETDTDAVADLEEPAPTDDAGLGVYEAVGYDGYMDVPAADDGYMDIPGVDADQGGQVDVEEDAYGTVHEVPVEGGAPPAENMGQESIDLDGDEQEYAMIDQD